MSSAMTGIDTATLAPVESELNQTADVTTTGTLPENQVEDTQTVAANTAEEVPLPDTQVAGAVLQPTTVQAASTSIYSDSTLSTEVAAAQALPEVNAELKKKPRTRSLFGSLFKQKNDKQKFEQKRFAGQTSKNPVIASAATTQVAVANGFAPAANPSIALEAAMDESDDEQPAGLMKLASLPGGMAHQTANGIWAQTARVDTHCFKPDLISLIHKIEKHYGKPAIVTSGYRDVRHNRKAGGVSFSRHTTCDAADIQVAEVSKWDLAEFVRQLPERGGVGTYCHTKSVHIDTGSVRDWNWRCRRKKR